MKKGDAESRNEGDVKIITLFPIQLIVSKQQKKKLFGKKLSKESCTIREGLLPRRWRKLVSLTSLSLSVFTDIIEVITISRMLPRCLK